MLQLIPLSSKKLKKTIQVNEYLIYITIITSLNKIIEHCNSQQSKSPPKLGLVL